MRDSLATESRATPRKISRRTALKKLAVITAASGLVGYGVGKLGTDQIQRETDQDVIDREKLNDLELGELGKRRFEYFCMWPYPRIWVEANNIIAAEKLDGKKLRAGVTYSLIDLLQLEDDYTNNFDPMKGYIVGVPLSSTPPFIRLSEAAGLSFTATCIARALALAPVEIHEWNTHLYGKGPILENYFDPNYQFVGHEFFQNIGTDATLYSADDLKFDLTFTPLVDLTLRYIFMDIRGNVITVPRLAELIKGYSISPLIKFAEPFLARTAVGADSNIDFEVRLEKRPIPDGEKRPRAGFDRIVLMNGQIVSREEHKSYYDTEGNFIRPSS